MAMYTITKEIHFCYGHRLPGHRGRCRHLHGHSARVQIELAAAKLNSQGMVADFGEVKTVLKHWIDENLDHRMLLFAKDPLVPVLKKWGEPLFILKRPPTAENIARLIFEFARKRKLPVSKVILWETPTSFASYRR